MMYMPLGCMCYYLLGKIDVQYMWKSSRNWSCLITNLVSTQRQHSRIFTNSDLTHPLQNIQSQHWSISYQLALSCVLTRICTGWHEKEETLIYCKKKNFLSVSTKAHCWWWNIDPSKVPWGATIATQDEDQERFKQK